MGTEAYFKGVTNLGASTLHTSITANLIEFFDWGFLNIGGFNNATIPSSGQYGGDRSKLRLVSDHNYTLGQVWEGFRSNWVWQSGLQTTTQPIQVSGVYVGGAFKPLNSTGAYAHYVNYPEGRIIFNTAISTTSNVQVNHSYKMVNVVNANAVPFLRELQFGSMRVDSEQFNIIGSGDWARLGLTRGQMPLVAVEASERTTYKPYALGGSQWATKGVVCYVIGEDENTVGKLADILSYQKYKTIHLFDLDAMATDNRFPLDARGMLASGALSYDGLIAQKPGGYLYSKGYFLDAEVEKLQTLNSIYYCPVKIKFETILGSI